jgi:hypothetical protein
MEEIKQEIIEVADYIALGGIAVATLIGGLLGFLYGQTIHSESLWLFIGIGGALGFVPTMLVSSLLFTLSSIATNTRILVQRDAARNRILSPSPSAVPFVIAVHELSDMSKEVIRRAKEVGFTSRLKGRDTFVLERPGEEAIYLNSNSEIEDMGREKGWL